MRRKVLVTGAGGQLGRELVGAFEGWDVVAADRSRLDVTDRAAVAAALEALRPTVVVNSASFTDVDGCELDIDGAYRTNAMALRWLDESCRRFGAHLCHISTDYVFDGTSDRPYVEWDQPNPRSVYGRSKLGGEREVAAPFTIVRTSWLFGVHGRNIVKTLLRLSAEPGDLFFVDDQIGRPTEARDLAGAIRRIVDAQLPGTYHVTNATTMSWFELARTTIGLAGGDPDRVRPISTEELDPPRPAPRPANSVLDPLALRLAGLEPLGEIHAPLARVLGELG